MTPLKRIATYFKQYTISKFYLLTAFSFILIFEQRIISQNTSKVNWEDKADSVILFAKSQLGVPYKWATCKPGVSFDCSGFTYFSYNSVGIKSYRGSSAYSSLGHKVPLKSCRKGDCILFTGTQPEDKSIGHVGIIIENKGEKLYFIHCSSSKRHFGVVVTEFYSSNYPKRFIETRRIFD